MKKFLLLMVVPLALLSAAEKVVVPADAKEIAPQVWQHTDKAGKTWIYRQTPFGLSKIEQAKVAEGAAAQPASTPEVKAEDLGDKVKFEKPGPFGKRIWERKKSEMTAEEKEWLAKSRPAPAENKPAEK